MRFAAVIFRTVLFPIVISGCSGADHSEASAVPSGVARAWCEELSVVAARRLGCAVDQLECRGLGDRVHLLTGCGKKARYLIFDQEGTWVKVESFHDRASFEIKCDVEDISIERETPDVWRAFGCGREKRYRLRCGQDGLTCEWVVDPGW